MVVFACGMRPHRRNLFEVYPVTGRPKCSPCYFCVNLLESVCSAGRRRGGLLIHRVYGGVDGSLTVEFEDKIVSIEAGSK